MNHNCRIGKSYYSEGWFMATSSTDTPGSITQFTHALETHRYKKENLLICQNHLEKCAKIKSL